MGMSPSLILLENFLQALAAGVLIGALYGLMCTGLGIIFGVMRVINFAQGDLMMLGMYFAWYAFAGFGTLAALGPYVGPIAAAILAGPALFVFGYALHRLLISRVTGIRVAGLEGDGPYAQLILTLCIPLALPSYCRTEDCCCSARKSRRSRRRCQPVPGSLVLLSARTSASSSTRLEVSPLSCRCWWQPASICSSRARGSASRYVPPRIIPRPPSTWALTSIVHIALPSVSALGSRRSLEGWWRVICHFSPMSAWISSLSCMRASCSVD